MASESKQPYAGKTKVTVERSKGELERLMQRFGATNLIFAATGPNDEYMSIGFRRDDRPYMLTFALPERGGSERDYRQTLMSRWREVVLLIKAKLVAVESGIFDFDQEFLAYAMLPNRMTIGQWALRQLEEITASGRMPELLPGTQTALPGRELEGRADG